MNRHFTTRSIRKRCGAFTLIELMIVVAILGIMATLAVPNYEGRVVRTQVKGAMQLAEGIKDAVEVHYAAAKRFPVDNTETAVPDAKLLIGNQVTAMQVADGAIHIHLGNRVNAHIEGKILTLQPAVVSGSPQSPISWLCGRARPVTGMDAVGENRTDVPDRYLPMDCRAW